jgi:hypothetical protein
MNKLYIPALALALVGADAHAQSSVGNDKAASKRYDGTTIVTRRTTPTMQAGGTQRDVIWSNDFSNPSDWVVGTVEGASDDTWVIGTTGPTGPYAGQVGTIASTTAANGFALFDSDLLCSGNQEATLTLATPVDLTNYSGLLLTFEQNYKRFYDNVWVDWSVDGTNWNPIQLNADMDHGGTAAATDNPQLTTVNMSALGGVATAYIRFRFESRPGSEDPLGGGTYPDNLVGCAYSWMVDDVGFITLPEYEIQMNYAYNSTTGTGEEYGRIPSSQLPATMNIGAELYNLGQNEQTGVTVEVAYSDAGGTPVPGFAGSLPVDPIGSDQSAIADGDINIPSGLAPGLYSATFEIEGDNLSLDNDPSNNSGTRNFEVTDNLYSVDAIGNHPEGTETLSQFGTASFTDNTDVYYMSMYYITNNFTATGVEVKLGPASVAADGASIEAFLLDTASITVLPASVSTWLNGASSGVHVLTQGDVDAGGVVLPFDVAVPLAPGAYFAVVHVTGSGTLASENAEDGEVYILDDTTVPQPGWTSAIFIPTDFNDDGTEGRHSYTNGNAYAIRLSNNASIGMQEMTELTGVSLFPNPTNGVFRISSDRTDVLFVEITDALGKVVYTTNFSAMATVDLSKMAAGVYSVAVSSATERTVQRVTVK